MTALSLANVPISVFALPVFAATMLAYFLLAVRRALGAPWAKTLMAGSLVLAISSMLNGIVIGVFVLVALLYL